MNKAYCRKIVSVIVLLLLGISPVLCRNFEEKELTVFNRKDSIELHGTLTLPTPTCKGAIVLATGSGLQNRDEEIFGHRPFKAIAEYLSSNGYAVLRMDDRGYGEADGQTIHSNSLNDDFVSDITCGLDTLRELFPDVKIGVLGHSEGSTSAIKIASRFPEKCDFIITLAAPAWEGDSLIMSQSRAIATALTGKWEGEKAERMILDLIKSPIPDYQKKVFAMGVLGEQLGEAAKLPAVQSSLSTQIDAMLTPWYKDMLNYNPAVDIEKVNMPWLAINGMKDVQVLPANLETIKGLNEQVTAILLENHNHLFQQCSSGLPQEYPLINEDISQETLNVILSWLDNNVAK